ncbi:unnamed protein product, partial [Coffea canephora]
PVRPFESRPFHVTGPINGPVFKTLLQTGRKWPKLPSLWLPLTVVPCTILENSSASFRRSSVKHIKFLGRGCCNLPIRDPHFSASAKSLERGEGGQPVPPPWIEAIFPEQGQPYAYLVRLDEPVGTFLFAWPCMWSLAFTANAGTLTDLKMLAFFFFVSFMSRNIACTINDYFDKDFDSQRTKGRRLASGAIAGFQALLFLAIQLLLGYGVLLAVNKLRFVPPLPCSPILITLICVPYYLHSSHTKIAILSSSHT